MQYTLDTETDEYKYSGMMNLCDVNRINSLIS